MKATIESTDRLVTLTNGALARAWEGVTEGGIPFVAYIALVQVQSDLRQTEFETALHEQHKKPSPETNRAIDLRNVV